MYVCVYVYVCAVASLSDRVHRRLLVTLHKSEYCIYMCVVDSPPKHLDISWAPKATLGSVPCACVLVSPYNTNRL